MLCNEGVGQRALGNINPRSAGRCQLVSAGVMGDMLYPRRLERRSTAELHLKFNPDPPKNLEQKPTAVVCRLEHLHSPFSINTFTSGQRSTQQCQYHLLRAFAILPSMSRAALEVSKCRSLSTHDLTTLLASPIVLNDSDSANAPSDDEEEGHIGHEGNLGLEFPHHRFLKALLEKPETDDQVLSTDLSSERLAQLQVAKLFKLVQLLYRAARTGLREQEREQPGLEEKRTSRFSGGRKGITKRRRRRAGVKPAASDLSALEQPRFLCSICNRSAIEVAGLCGHVFCRECQQTWGNISSSCAVCRSPMGEPISLFV